jgi:hypothetical protein
MLFFPNAMVNLSVPWLLEAKFVLVCDNATYYQSKWGLQIFDAAEVKLMSLPPYYYYHDLNLIELCFASLKQQIWSSIAPRILNFKSDSELQCRAHYFWSFIQTIQAFWEFCTTLLVLFLLFCYTFSSFSCITHHQLTKIDPNTRS